MRRPARPKTRRCRPPKQRRTRIEPAIAIPTDETADNGTNRIHADGETTEQVEKIIDRTSVAKTVESEQDSDTQYNLPLFVVITFRSQIKFKPKLFNVVYMFLLVFSGLTKWGRELSS